MSPPRLSYEAFMNGPRRAKFQQMIEIAEHNVEADMKTLREAGVKIIEPDLVPFREAAKPVVEKYASGKLGELVERIQSVK